MIKFYLRGDPQRTVHLPLDWLKGQVLLFIAQNEERQAGMPGRARVAEFLEYYDLVPVDKNVVSVLTEITGDYKPLLAEARSLGAKLRVTGAPEDVTERVVQEIRDAAHG